MSNPFKRMVEKNDFLYAEARLFRNRKAKAFLSLFRDMPAVVRMKTQPGNLGRAPIAVFDAPDPIGLFAYLRRVAEFLYYCDRMGFAPILRWSGSGYRDPSIGTTDNPFEYFFEQPFPLTREEIEERPFAEYAPGTLTMAREYLNGALYVPDETYLATLADPVRLYLKPNGETQKVLDAFLEKYGIGEDVLGVHMRGTDFKKAYRNHPIYVEPEEYYPHIDEAFASGRFKKVFLATDDNSILKEYLDHYGEEKVVYSTETFRGEGDLGIHRAAEFDERLSPYREGLNALCDVYGLARCGGFISGVSNVAVFTRILKKSRSEGFVFDRLLNKGLHKKGINAVKEKFN